MLIEIIPALNDNYIFAILNPATNNAIIIDPATSKDVEEFLSSTKYNLKYILNTHHHNDHIGGNIVLKEKYQCKIIGFRGDKDRIQGIDILVDDEQIIEIEGLKVKIFHTPGHTLGHIVYYFSELESIFVGDTVFSVGCGRLFEGTAKQMYSSINKILKLNEHTKIYCAHEYTLKNIAFAKTLEPTNEDLLKYEIEVTMLRDQGQPTIPTNIAIQKKINPFFRCDESIYHKIFQLDSDIEVFTKIRELRNSF